MKALIAAMALAVSFAVGCVVDDRTTEEGQSSTESSIDACPVIIGCDGGGGGGGGDGGGGDGGGGGGSCGGSCDPRDNNSGGACSTACGQRAHCFPLGDDFGFCRAS